MSLYDSRSSPPTLQLSDYIRVFQRRRLILGIGIVMGVALGWAFSQLTGPTYESTASVLVNPVGVSSADSANRPNQLVNLATERQVMVSAAVTERAAAIVGDQVSPQDLLRRVRIAIPEGAQVLNVTYSANDPSLAQSGAQALALAYLEHRGATAQAEVDSRLQTINAEINDATESLDAANRRLVNSEERTLEYTTALTEVNSLSTRLQDLQVARSEVESLSTEPGEIIAPAPTPTSPVSLPAWLVMVVGASAGALLAIPLAFVRERLDDRLWDADDLRALGIGTVLGTVATPPHSGGDDPRPGRTSGASAEGYRRLSLNLMSVAATHEARRIAVVAATTNDRSPEVVAELAVATARMGNHILLLDADIGHHDIEQYLAIAPDPGFGDVLLGKQALTDAVQILEVLPQLRVIPQGRALGDEIEIPWNEFSDMLLKLPGSARVMMVNVGPALETADSLRICSLLDSVVVIAHRGRTRKRELIQAVDQLLRSGASVAGIVFVGSTNV